MSAALFVYGTLTDEELVHRLTGRRFAREIALLPDFERIEKPGEYPEILPRTGVRVQGFLLLDIDPAALARLDEYEEVGVLYRREEVAVLVGRQTRRCFVYTRLRS